MARWDESKHPRDDEGQFAEKWATRISEAMAPASSGGHSYVRGRDVRDELDWDRLYDLLPKETGAFNSGSKDGDAVLGAIYEAQGFHGKPQVVDRLPSGVTTYYRGVRDVGYGPDGQPITESPEGWDHSYPPPRWDQVPKTAREMQDELRHGSRHYPGTGMYGNGTYAGTSLPAAKGYATMGNGSLSVGGVAAFQLRSDARIAQVDDIEQLILSDKSTGERAWILEDAGRMAAALGYDAVMVDPEEGVIVVLNRTAMIIQKRAV